MCFLHPASQEAEPQGGLPWPPWGWGTRPAVGVGSHWVEFPGIGDIEDDVMRVWIKDSWQPPALLLENFRGWGGGSLGSQAQKQKVKSNLLSGKRSTPVLTHRLRMTNCVTVHKLFHLLPRHQGLINHCKLSHNYTMLNTNRGDPRIH